MSEYRTHLRESVEALRDAAQRVAEALDETAGLGQSDSTSGPAPNREDTDCGIAVASPAPSSPPDTRRWWINTLSGHAYSSEQSALARSAGGTIVPVVPAATLAALGRALTQHNTTTGEPNA
ncbi:MAG: hypothetical protein EKK62_17085 [Acidimicrobiia bacterium]|nr:MAG: hypothetical protein EKK62_17085 [Acidimicrobiia bacterium]